MAEQRRNDEFKPFWAVWTKPVRGQGSMRPMKKTWPSFEEADQAAEQMARKHAGVKFFVMQAVSRAHFPAPVDTPDIPSAPDY